MEIKENTVVFVQYQLRDESGEMLEDAYDDEPYALLQGHANVISGLDAALLGHVVGDEFEVSVPPEDAYGLKQENSLERVSKKYFANPKRLKPGMQTNVRTDDGTRVVTVVKIGGKVIDVDHNHPLAGQTLHCRVRITGAREATPEELAHGHPVSGH